MSITTTTHLNFRGQAREALEFYGEVFDAQPVVVTYGQAHDPQGEAEHVLWGEVAAPSGFHVMAYDVQTDRDFDPGVHPVYVSLRCGTEQEVTTAYEGLARAARHVRTPLGPSAFSPLYGMLTDRFGVTWVIDQAVAFSAG
ncbi:VOC family protein [Kineococcus rhizosphaerae]|uniref:PhnB protein n=1 Tax=Kineococcus rhizosphaerae TaxID=559628 RepID=A0A2T0RB99_9ACTN|nr:VOC family protein [Kineococcus rhizosphaerae]PRY18444.1 PhnB protein [Kineococcus rhizosphaerae]